MCDKLCLVSVCVNPLQMGFKDAPQLIYSIGWSKTQDYTKDFWTLTLCSVRYCPNRNCLFFSVIEFLCSFNIYIVYCFAFRLSGLFKSKIKWHFCHHIYLPWIWFSFLNLKCEIKLLMNLHFHCCAGIFYKLAQIYFWSSQVGFWLSRPFLRLTKVPVNSSILLW